MPDNKVSKHSSAKKSDFWIADSVRDEKFETFYHIESEMFRLLRILQYLFEKVYVFRFVLTHNLSSICTFQVDLLVLCTNVYHEVRSTNAA